MQFSLLTNYFPKNQTVGKRKAERHVCLHEYKPPPIVKPARLEEMTNEKNGLVRFVEVQSNRRHSDLQLLHQQYQNM